jgi:hypothetical protein
MSGWSAPRRPAGSSTASTATRSLRSSGEDPPKLSAGRVQSVAVRMVVERERLRMAFVSAGYWDLAGLYSNPPPPPRGGAKAGSSSAVQRNLVFLGKRRLAIGKDFDDSGKLRSDEVRLLTGEEARRLAEVYRSAGSWRVSRWTSGPTPTGPRPPSPQHAPAGGQPQAPLPARRPCRSRSGSTRTGTSPTCAPIPRRCPSSGPNARGLIQKLYGRNTLSRAAAVQDQGEERPGGARGDPAGGRSASSSPRSCAGLSTTPS